MKQLQLDVYGEVLDTFYIARRAGLATTEQTWDLECALLEHLETIWREPDEGIWEVRGGRRQFTHSKVMAWVAFDRARPVDRGVRPAGARSSAGARRATRSTRACASMASTRRQNAFVQSYGSTALDASLLLLPLVGFLPPDDPRVRGTIAAIERRLMRNGLVLRYDTESRDGRAACRAKAPSSPAASGSPTTTR